MEGGDIAHKVGKSRDTALQKVGKSGYAALQKVKICGDVKMIARSWTQKCEIKTLLKGHAEEILMNVGSRFFGSEESKTNLFGSG